MPLDITHRLIQQYSEAHTSAPGDLLRQIDRSTHANVLMPRMLSGHLQGKLLSMISCMIKPSRILELGTYTGYSALCLAEGLASDGRLITIDANEELEQQVRSYFQSSPFANQIDYRIGKAATIIPQLIDMFDLVFIDADKENNTLYYDLLIDRVPLGGFILVDNVLWSGKVVEDKIDKDTLSIQQFNMKIQNDNRVDNLLLPIRDGIMLIQKVKAHV
jgi:caffeoyl-CoA O-methyltransferase